MKAAQLVSPGKYEIVEIDTPVPGPDELLIRIQACGLCKSEMGNWKGQYPEGYPMPPGMTGHEPIGVVAGGEDADFPRGTAVTAILWPPCGYAEYAVAKKSATARIPDVLLGTQVLGEPLACAVNAVKRGSMNPGRSVLVIGAGYMGLLLVSVLRHCGFAPIVVADMRQHNLELARQAGADICIKTSDPSAHESLKSVNGNQGFETIYEAAGTQSALDLATRQIAIKGTLHVYGYHSQNSRTINMEQWNYKGINIVNAHERKLGEYADGLKRGLSLFRHKLNYPDFISHMYSLVDINEAFNTMEQHPKGYIKGVIQMG